MEGAPSHVDTFDYKTEARRARPARQCQGAHLRQAARLPHGSSTAPRGGLWISELFPELAKQADELCCCAACTRTCPLIRRHSCKCTRASSSQYGRRWERGPSTAWAPTTRTCPASSRSVRRSDGGPSNYGSLSCRPSPGHAHRHRLSTLRRAPRGPGAGASVSNIKNPNQSPDDQRMQLDFIQSSTAKHLNATRTTKASRVPSDVHAGLPHAEDLPKLMDLANETAADQGPLRHRRTDDRELRAVPPGPRFVERVSASSRSPRRLDHHRDPEERPGDKAQSIDKAIAGLLADLKARGSSGYRWCCGAASRPDSLRPGRRRRDHNHRGFTTWMAAARSRAASRTGPLTTTVTRPSRARIAHQRLARHDPTSAGAGPREADVPLCGRDMRLTDVKGNVSRTLLVESDALVVARSPDRAIWCGPTSQSPAVREQPLKNSAFGPGRSTGQQHFHPGVAAASPQRLVQPPDAAQVFRPRSTPRGVFPPRSTFRAGKDPPSANGDQGELHVAGALNSSKITHHARARVDKAPSPGPSAIRPPRTDAQPENCWASPAPLPQCRR